MANVHAMADLAAKAARPIYTFPVSPKLAEECGVESVGLVKLTARQEKDIGERAGSSAHKLAYELVLNALAEVNGKKVSVSDGTADKAYNEFDPKLRQLVMTAYGRLHSPSEDEAESFLAGMSVKVS